MSNQVPFVSCFARWVASEGTLPIRMNRIRSSHLAWGEAGYDSLCTRKRTGRNRPAWFHASQNRRSDKLAPTPGWAGSQQISKMEYPQFTQITQIIQCE